MRTCPQCSREFYRCRKSIGKRKVCPGCETHLYYSGKDTILYEDYEAANGIVSMLEDHISKRDGVVFVFEWQDRVKELVCAYGLLDRAKAFLARQRVDVGLSAAQFVTEIVESILHSQFWTGIVQSIAMFMNHVSDVAKDVFKRHKDEIEQKQRDVSLLSLVDFTSYQEV